MHSDTDFTIFHVTTCNLQDSPLTNKGEGKEFVISVLCLIKWYLMFRIKAPGHKFSSFNFVPSQKMDAYWPCTWILSIKFHHYFTACIAYREVFIDFYYKIQSLITILFVCLRYCREGFTVWKIWDDMKHSAGLTQDLFLFCLLMLSVQSVRRRHTLTWLE